MKWTGRSDWNAKAPFTVLRRGEEETGTVSGLEKNMSKIDLHCPMSRTEFVCVSLILGKA
jgi:hypothetical protein